MNIIENPFFYHDAFNALLEKVHNNELVTEDDFWLLSIELEEFIDELNYVLKSYMKYEYIVTQKMPEEFEMLEALINLNDKVINYIFDNYKD